MGSDRDGRVQAVGSNPKLPLCFSRAALHGVSFHQARIMLWGKNDELTPDFPTPDFPLTPDFPAVLEHPEAHVGQVIELTGPKSEDMRAVAAEYSEALGRTITYVDVPMAEWRERELPARGLPEHVAGHMKTMAQLHADNRYDRLTHDFEAIIGRPATSIREYVAKHPEMFGSSKPARVFP